MSAAFDSDVTVDVDVGFDGSGPFTASPTFTDIAQYVRGFSWTRGREPFAGSFPAGHGDLILDNTDGRFYRFNTSSPYHPNLSNGNPIRIRATHNAVTHPLIYGYADKWVSPFPTNREELVTVPVMERLSRLTRNTIGGPYPQERTDVRIGRVLDSVGWPAGARSLDVGFIQAAGYAEKEQSGLAMIRHCELAEQGHFFQDASGDATFTHRAEFSGVTAAFTFGPSGADLTYTDVTTSNDDFFLFNKVTVIAANGTSHTYTDSASVAKRGPVTYDAVTDTVREIDAPDTALWIVESNKTSEERIIGFQVDPGGDPANLWPLLGVDLTDVVRIKVSFPGSGTQLDQLVAIERITHDMDMVRGTWIISFGCRPLSTVETQEYWVLGSSALGTGTRLL